MNATISVGIKRFINLRVRFGFKYDRGSRNLEKLASYLESVSATTLKTKIVLDWLATFENASAGAQSHRLRNVRHFASYWKTFDSKTEIPDRNLISHRTWRSTPKIFTSAECKKLLGCCNRLGKLKSASSLTVPTFRTLFGLIMATGLRRNEVVKLKRKDVDLERGDVFVELTIRKSRIIPVHHSVLTKLRRYAARRDKTIPSSKSDSFFLVDEKRGVSGHGIHSRFKLVCKAANISYRPTKDGARVQDLRHTFAVNVIQSWLMEKRNIHEMMPVLSTYMGHNHPTDTYWYLTGTPELMRLGLKLEGR